MVEYHLTKVNEEVPPSPKKRSRVVDKSPVKKKKVVQDRPEPRNASPGPSLPQSLKLRIPPRSILRIPRTPSPILNSPPPAFQLASDHPLTLPPPSSEYHPVSPGSVFKSSEARTYHSRGNFGPVQPSWSLLSHDQHLFTRSPSATPEAEARLKGELWQAHDQVEQLSTQLDRERQQSDRLVDELKEARDELEKSLGSLVEVKASVARVEQELQQQKGLLATSRQEVERLKDLKDPDVQSKSTIPFPADSG